MKETWSWRGFSIAYQSEGTVGPAILLVHGFGASMGHWRKNIPELAQFARVYAIDLIGFGGSAKPTPQKEINYTFETWASQLADFISEVIRVPTIVIGNSIGCIAAMQLAVSYPNLCLGVILLNCSLRLLHERKRNDIPWYRSWGAGIMQELLGYRTIGRWFFNQIAKREVVRKILRQAYKKQEAVTDELLDIIMTPALDPGAVDVFLAFTRYSQGPLPEDLLPILPCPGVILWGTDDPWEPISLGQNLARFPAIKEFIPLPGLGHCPQDEAPDIVNPILREWVLVLGMDSN